MSNLVYCKACGYIFEAGRYEFCPACGVPAKMFEPYVDKIPADRRKILKLDIHPVIVHAPQAIGLLLFLFGAAMAVLVQTGLAVTLAADLKTTVQVLSVVLPFTIAAAIASGIVDAKYRYKTTSSIALKRKKAVGGAFLLFSLGMAFLSLQDDFLTALGLQLAFLACAAASVACSAYLGLVGAGLVHGIMGGPMPKKKAPAKAAGADAAASKDEGGPAGDGQ